MLEFRNPILEDASSRTPAAVAPPWPAAIPEYALQSLDHLPIEVETFVELGADPGILLERFASSGRWREALLVRQHPTPDRAPTTEPARSASLVRTLRVTWDGVVPCFRPGSIDLLAATVTYENNEHARRTTAQAMRAVRPRGVALFIQPNPLYWKVLSEFAMEVWMEGEERFATNGERGHALLKPIELTHRWATHANDPTLLGPTDLPAPMPPDLLQALLAEAGSLAIQARIAPDTKEVMGALGQLADQSRLQPATRAAFMELASRRLPGPFAHGGQALSPFVVMSTQPARARSSIAPPAPVTPPRQRPPQFSFHLHVVISDGAARCEGWVVGDVEIIAVRLHAEGADAKIAVGAVRYDVALARDALGHWPLPRRIFSGLYAPRHNQQGAFFSGSPVAIEAVSCNGECHPLGQVLLEDGVVAEVSSWHGADVVVPD